MDQVLQSLQELLMTHLAASQLLTANAIAGTDLIRVANTSRFREEDDAFLMSTSLNIAEKIVIAEVMDYDLLRLESPLQSTWTTASSSFVQKSIGHMPLKRVHKGDLTIIPDFPTITIDPVDEDNDWMTIRGTEHNYNFSIKTYVLHDNFEATNIALIKYTKQIREILLDHIHPIIKGTSTLLTQDLLKGQTVAFVSSTAGMKPGQMLILRDAAPRPASQENYVKNILSPTTVELQAVAEFDYLVLRQGEIIAVKRYLFDTRPSNANYGFVTKGASLLKASEIKWFGKEFLYRQGNIQT